MMTTTTKTVIQNFDKTKPEDHNKRTKIALDRSPEFLKGP